MNSQVVINEIIARMVDEGFLLGTESHNICKRAIQFLDFSYQRSEELDDKTTIDCSTLVSQSYWEGAAIGIPFVAENQRTAMSGQTVSSLSEMIPGDVLVKYASLNEAPDKTWNHVGLYLGRDFDGEQWLIESTSKFGVRLSKVTDFDQKGGLKRFTFSKTVFDLFVANEALRLTTLVPKFGRLGVRQYCISGATRLAHKGLDIYVNEGTCVYATLSGKVSLIGDDIEKSFGVSIMGDNLIVRYLMLGELFVQEGAIVSKGVLLGKIVTPSKNSDIVYSTAKINQSHLHLEVEKEAKFLNHLYFSKVGELGLPFSR
ncbi:MAG: peptidoglycan DD-metalloendopeptidase family protein [bacterium]|nr:peptidoglycan DD-metalloendopeptidase family protein [bacterium]